MKKKEGGNAVGGVVKVGGIDKIVAKEPDDEAAKQSESNASTQSVGTETGKTAENTEEKTEQKNSVGDFFNSLASNFKK